MQCKLRLIPAATAACVLAACSGGGSGGGGGGGATATGGVVVDGYLKAAYVYCDTNSNGAIDAGETPVTTGLDGKFSFSSGCASPMIAKGGTNIDTGLPFVGLMKAPAGATVISPLTTLVVHGATQERINTALGLAAGTVLTTADPHASSASGALVNPDLLKKTLAVQQILQKVTETLAGLAGLTGSDVLVPIYDIVAKAFAAGLASVSGTPLVTTTGTGPAIDFARLNALVSAAGTEIVSAASPPASASSAAVSAAAAMAPIATAVASAGGPAQLANVISPALKVQADPYLAAASDAASITAITKGGQANNAIATAVKNALTAGTLSASAAPAAVTALASAIAASAVVTPAASTTATGGVVVAGYQQGATVTCDINADGWATTGETSVSTGLDGKFSFASGCASPLRSSGGTGVDTGLPFVGVVKAPAGATVLSPLTTLVADGATQDQVNTALALAAGTVLTTTDPEALNASGALVNPDLLKKTLAMQQLLQKATETLAGLAGLAGSAALDPVYDAVAKAFAAGLASGAPLVGTATGAASPTIDVARLNALVAAAATGVANAANVDPAIKTALTAAGGPAQLANVISPALKVQADPYLAAASDPASIAAVALAGQGNKVIASNVKVALSNAKLGASTSSADVATLASEIAGNAALTIPSVTPTTGGGTTTTATGGTTTTATGGTTTTATGGTTTTATGGTTTTATGGTTTTATGGTTTTATGGTTTTAGSTTTTTLTGNFLYLANDSISLTDGVSVTSYTAAQFQSTGINVKWPMASTAAIKLSLVENGSFNFAASQTLDAAVEITQDTPAGSGKVSAYIRKVQITKTGSNIVLSVPALADAMVYGVSGDGTQKAVVSFANAVANVTNTLSSAANTVSTVGLGDVVNYAVNGVSNDFNGIYSLSGKYKVTVVVSQLPLSQANGKPFPTQTVSVPTLLDAQGNPVASSYVPVSGYGLVGYINLVK